MPRNYENYSTELGNYVIHKPKHHNHHYTDNNSHIHTHAHNNNENLNTDSHNNHSNSSITTNVRHSVQGMHRYGNDAVKHWKYNFLSSGHTETKRANKSDTSSSSTPSSSSSSTLPNAYTLNSNTTHSDLDDVTYPIHKKILEEKERIAAAGLGYGHMHSTHYSHKSPHGSKHLGSLSGRIEDTIGVAKNFIVSEDEGNRLYKSHVANSVGYGRKSKYRFSAFARTGPQ